jgi:glyoxylase-like metal-dependent hydrolase (beta-lactamase superfamily II)
MTLWTCATCAVEYLDSVEPPQRCPICEDERQYVPPSGQRWTTVAELAEEGYRTSIDEVEPNLYGITADPRVGIGQRSLLIRTPNGNLLWDPTGYLDQAAVDRINELGGLAAVAASHPHMFGVQVQWSHAFGDVPVYVAEADKRWLQRTDPVVRYWEGTFEPIPGLTFFQCGGHFPGSAAVHWPEGADGRGVVLAGDTVFPTPDRQWVSFMRSYPNNIPLSAGAVRKVVRAFEPFTFDRLYGNFAGFVEKDAKAAVRRSADRYIGWISGDFDADT